MKSMYLLLLLLLSLCACAVEDVADPSLSVPPATSVHAASLADLRAASQVAAWQAAASPGDYQCRPLAQDVELRAIFSGAPPTPNACSSNDQGSACCSSSGSCTCCCRDRLGAGFCTCFCDGGPGTSTP